MLNFVRRATFGLGLLVFAYLVGSIDWRGEAPTTLPSVSRVVSHAALRVGSGSAVFTPKEPGPLGGFSHRGSKTFTKVLDPIEARALVLTSRGEDLGLVSLDLVLIPEMLARRIQAEAIATGLDAVVVTATHTHSGPGGYWDNVLARFGGLGSYDAEFEQTLVDAAGEALQQARTKLRPASVESFHGEAPALCQTRISGRAPDRRMDSIVFRDASDPPEATEGPAQAPPVIGRVVILGCHPTLLGEDDLRLSAGWPGAFVRAFDAPTLLLQGAVGDVSSDPAAPGAPTDSLKRMQWLGAQFASAVGALERSSPSRTDDRFEYAQVELSLLGADGSQLLPTGLQTLGSNLLYFLAPRQAQVACLRIGDTGLLLLPGEVVSPLASRWARSLKLAGAPHSRVVSLANGYLGYLETPEALAAGAGESHRAYYGASTVKRLETGLKACSHF